MRLDLPLLFSPITTPSGWGIATSHSRLRNPSSLIDSNIIAGTLPWSLRRQSLTPTPTDRPHASRSEASTEDAVTRWLRLSPGQTPFRGVALQRSAGAPMTLGVRLQEV